MCQQYATQMDKDAHVSSWISNAVLGMSEMEDIQGYKGKYEYLEVVDPEISEWGGGGSKKQGVSRGTGRMMLKPDIKNYAIFEYLFFPAHLVDKLSDRTQGYSLEGKCHIDFIL